jgi:hypothetical protein
VAISCNSTKKSKSVLGKGPLFEALVPKPSDDGLSFETAIVITEKSETKGVTAEYNWIREQYTGYVVKGQSLQNHEKKPYDVITITFPDGRDLPLYFDISNFFGKF